MAIIAIDIETDGLLDELTTVHSLVMIPFTQWKTLKPGTVISLDPSNMHLFKSYYLPAMEEDDILIAHSGLGFDFPALQKVLDVEFPCKTWDSLLLSKLFYPNLADLDFTEWRKLGYMDSKTGKLRKDLPEDTVKVSPGSHSLKDWGIRLKCHKQDIKAILGKEWYKKWTPELQDYCILDVKVLIKLLTILWAKPDFDRFLPAIILEHKFKYWVHKQEQHGFLFDVEKAEALKDKLMFRLYQLESKLKEKYLPKMLPVGRVITKRKRLVKKGALCPAHYGEGVEYTKLKTLEFSPSSGDCIAIWLKLEHNWEPFEFSKEKFSPDIQVLTGFVFKPSLTEKIVDELDIPGADMLVEYAMLTKRLGQLSEGDNAWLKKQVNGRIHGGVDTMGAGTFRCTHKKPNLAQVTSLDKPYGKECRELFGASEQLANASEVSHDRD